MTKQQALKALRDKRDEVKKGLQSVYRDDWREGNEHSQFINGLEYAIQIVEGISQA